MENLVAFIKKTKDLLAHLQSEFSTDEREAYIEKVQQLLDERGQLLSHMPDLHSLKDSSKDELIKLETKIQSLLENRQNEIKKDLQILQLQKKKTSKYVDPYGDISFDGMYLDKKK
ncbi:flagellar protein FliT [Bacillus sp. Bva_UNVM-123]|uniref:flagellar protein FliT n=1 Tax=Bacillus sp. Bva_UNVM-123 TaxID=2829798 RepID=UPI00391EFBED